MELPVVVGIDGSESSLAAVDWGVDEAARHGLPVRLLHATRWQNHEVFPTENGTGRPDTPAAETVNEIVGRAVERATRRGPGVEVLVDVRREDTVPALLDAGRNSFALIVGPRGRGAFAGLLLGSVSLTVAGRAQCPIIVVRGDQASIGNTHQRILLGVGDASTRTAAVRFAFQEAEVRGAVLSAVRTWRSPLRQSTEIAGTDDASADLCRRQAYAELDEALDEAARDHPSVLVRRRAVEGRARGALRHWSAAADLLVVGAPRRHGRNAGLQLGRVAHTVLHHAACPVAVVPA